MSSFIQKAKHPITGKIQKAIFQDDYYGPHLYGVGFKKDGTDYIFGDSYTNLEFFKTDELIGKN